MPLDVKEAVKAIGIKIYIDNCPGKLVPVTTEILERFGVENGQPVEPGQMIAAWRNENNAWKARVLDPYANNGIEIAIARNEDEPVRVSARQMDEAIVRLADMERAAREDEAAVEKDNVRRQREYQSAVTRGEIVDPPVEKRPTYAEGAFDNLDILGKCVLERLSQQYSNAFAGVAGASLAALAEFNVTSATQNKLSAEEIGRASEARSIRREIARIENGVAQAPANEPDITLVGDAVDGLDVEFGDSNEARSGAMIGNRKLAELAFKPFTTTPLSDLNAKVLSPRAVATLFSGLERFEDKDWGQAAIKKAGDVLAERMPGYTFNAKLFSRDGVDMLVVGDHAGPMLYAWDRNTRVNDFEPADVSEVYTEADVVSEEQLSELRERLNELRFEMPDADPDFSFDEEDADINP